MNEFSVVPVADIHLGASEEHHLDNWPKTSPCANYALMPRASSICAGLIACAW